MTQFFRYFHCKALDDLAVNCPYTGVCDKDKPETFRVLTKRRRLDHEAYHQPDILNNVQIPEYKAAIRECVRRTGGSNKQVLGEVNQNPLVFFFIDKNKIILMPLRGMGFESKWELLVYQSLD